MSETPKKDISIEAKVTNRCNQNCFFCVNNDRPESRGDLDSRQFAARLNEWAVSAGRSALRVKEVRMTGGEPLLNLPTVLEIGRTCSTLGIRSGINTNASLLDASTARLLKQAGLEIVKASLDAVEEEVFRRMRGLETSLQDSLRGIRTAVSSGFRVILRFTLCSYNRSQLIECYRLARDLGVAKFQVKPLVRSGRARRSNAFLDREELCCAMRELAATVNGPPAMPEILCWPPADAAGLPAKGCGSIDKIYFSAEGDACVCNFLPLLPPMGNLHRETLDTLLDRRRTKVRIGPGGHVYLTGCPQEDYFLG